MSLPEHADCTGKDSRLLLKPFPLGFFMILSGIIILITAFLFYDGQDSADFGVLIFIGPFPIIIGAGPDAPWIVLFVIALAILSIVIVLIMRREIHRG
jgi:uncharacterized membrane protein